ncbi:MAG: LuxR C-terminal-related transcriptional regulator [Novosphingobium sp.]
MLQDAHFSDGSASQTVSLGFLQNAITQSSIGIAVCDRELNVRFCNAAFDRFLHDDSLDTGTPPAPLHGAALLRLFGLTDLSFASANVEPGLAWHGLGRGPVRGGLDAGHDFHIAIEYFLDPDKHGGWLITAQRSVVGTRDQGMFERQQITKSQRLTEREKQIVLALNLGQANKTIARDLGISPRTVEFHRSRIFKRFGVNSVVELIRRVIIEVECGGVLKASSPVDD